MRGGRHFVEFASETVVTMNLGVIRLVSLAGSHVRLGKLEICNSRKIEIPENCKVGREQCPLLRL